MRVRGLAAPFYDVSGALRGVSFALEEVTKKNAIEEMLHQSQNIEVGGQLAGSLALTSRIRKTPRWTWERLFQCLSSHVV
jgi:hypothetical protein